MWQLVINGPGYFDTSYELPEGVTSIGRADENEIVLSGDLVSRRHARLVARGEALDFVDLGSRNGTQVNGKPHTGTRRLTVGDVVTLGENTLTVRQPRPSEAAATEVVDTDSGVRRFGRGKDIAASVVLARDLRDSVVMRVLDNFKPFDMGEPPVPTKALRPSGDTDEDESKTSELSLDEAEAVVGLKSLALMYRIAEVLAGAPSLQEFLDQATDLVMQRVGATTGVVLLRHATGLLTPSAVRHSQRLKKGEVPVSDAIVEASLTQAKAIAVADVRDDARFADRESVVLYGVDQVLCIPIGRAAPFHGVLYLNRSSVTEEPVEALLDVASAVAQLFLTAIQRFQTRPQQDDRLRRLLERFHAPDIVERRVVELSQTGARLTSLEEKPVTVLFADIAGFSEWTKVHGPARAVELLDEFYTRMTQLIFSFEGTVDKFLGDSVMALFGAPYGKGDDAIRAVRAALALRASWEQAMAPLPEKERLSLRLGLNTGKVLAGTVGNALRLDYTAVGEPVNIAAWLCGSAEPGQVLITGKTLAGIGARFDVAPLGERPLAGGRTKTSVFEVLEEDSEQGTLSGVR